MSFATQRDWTRVHWMRQKYPKDIVIAAFGDILFPTTDFVFTTAFYLGSLIVPALGRSLGGLAVNR